MRIAFLVKGFPRLSETFVLHELLELRRQGLDLRLVSVLLPEDRLVHPAAEALCTDVTYLRTASCSRRWKALRMAVRRHPLGLARALVWLGRQHSLPALRRLLDALVLIQWCRSEGVGHVHAHFATVPTTTAYLAKKISGLPYSFSAHAKDVYTTDPAALRLRVQHASAVVTCTDANRVYFEEQVGVPPGRVRTMRHGVPTEHFLSVPRHPVPGRLLTVGRLVPKKGYDVVAQALAGLLAAGHDVTWHVVGGGPEKEALIELVASLGLTARVRLLGSVTSDQVAAELSEAAVFTMAPRVLADGDRDGIPNVVLEAMLAGVPVVATAVSGLPEVITSGVTGTLVAPDDPAALCAALAEALTGAAVSRRTELARAWAAEQCDLASSVRPLAALLREITGQRALEPA
ncbi:MAG: glycosyltransferase family 4 protein [Mycobacteriales bacterium]